MSDQTDAPRPADAGTPLWSRLLSIFLGVLLLAAIGGVVYTIVRPAAGERFTEFYLLGPGGMAAAYPDDLMVGEEARVIVGIVNREQAPETYSVDIVVDGVKSKTLGPVRLGSEAKWEQTVTFSATHPGAKQKVEFFLYREGQTGVYQTLYLWVNVT